MNHFPGLRSDHCELELVVELLRQMLRVHDCLVRPDDRVHVLEEVDPWRDVVRPLDVLGLGLVLAKVACRVEELLRHDRCAQPCLGQCHALSALIGAPALEVLAHRGDVEYGDRVAVEDADAPLPFAERDELHASPADACGNAGVGVRRSYETVDLEVLPRSTSISPVEVP